MLSWMKVPCVSEPSPAIDRWPWIIEKYIECMCADRPLMAYTYNCNVIYTDQGRNFESPLFTGQTPSGDSNDAGLPHL